MSEADDEILEESRPPRLKKVRGRDGQVREYYLHEMGDAELGAWMDGVGKRVVSNSKGKTVRTNFSGMHADLISLCLKDAAGNRVPKALVQGWGANIKNKLFAECQEMNGLTDKAEEEEEKNSEGAATDGGGVA